jgi:tetratricopeptide (TPR) repeat protein
MQRARLNNLLTLQQQDPNDAFITYALALEYQSLNELENAWNHFELLLNKYPEYLPTYYQAGLFTLKQGNYKLSLELILKGIHIAKSLKDNKTLNELNELYESIEDEME